MNLTEDKVKLVGYTFAISLLIPPNVGLNILGLNFEDLPLVVLFSYLFYLKIDDYKIMLNNDNIKVLNGIYQRF